MRFNLICPYADKEDAKRLGARWDADRKTWYVIDPPDLLKFSRWLRAYPAQEQQAPAIKHEPHKKKTHKRKSRQCKSRQVIEGQVFAVTGGKFVPACSCDVLPWDDCEHTEALAQLALSDQYRITMETM